MKKEIKQAYKELCLKHYSKNKFLKDFVDKNTIPIEKQLNSFFTQKPTPSQIILGLYLLGKGYDIGDDFEPKIGTISDKCSLCNKKMKKSDEIIAYSPYWFKQYRLCHKDCIDIHKNDIYEQQKIDYSCNDCKFFEVKKDLTKKEKDIIKINKQNKAPMRFGTCLKKNKNVIADINFCCTENHKCFKHRNEKIIKIKKNKL